MNRKYQDNTNAKGRLAIRIFIVGLLLASRLNSFGQSYLDKQIFIPITDTSNLYQKVKIALGKHYFQVVENGNYDTVTTYPRDLKKIPGYALAKVIINKDTVIISGIYGFIRQNYMGYTRSPNSYKDIMYMKASKLWPLLMSVAGELGSQFTYSK
jgi:hypothetical protein